MGLGALWREGLLTQKVLVGETRGWRKHPQLDRFKDHPEPLDAVGFYLTKIGEEANTRGYSYNSSKIKRPTQHIELIPITTGQLHYEFSILRDRTLSRTPAWYERLKYVKGLPEAHPIFKVIEGDVELWEVSYWRGGSRLKGRTDSHQAATPSSLASL